MAQGGVVRPESGNRAVRGDEELCSPEELRAAQVPEPGAVLLVAVELLESLGHRPGGVGALALDDADGDR